MEEDSRQENRMGSTPGKYRPAKRAAVAASPPFGLNRANAGQGNCVFEALGQGLDPKQPKAARGVRAAIVNHIRRHDARYKPWWDGREPTNEEAPCDSWDKYLTMLAKVGSWGGSLELAAAAVHYDRPVLVFRAQGVPEVYNAQGRAGEAIPLWFHNKHYEPLEDLVSEAHTRHSALPSEVASDKTRLAAMPARLVSTRNVAANSSAKPLPGSSTSERRGNAHVTSASVGRGAAEECSSVAFDDDLDSEIGDKQKDAVLENETKKRKLGHPKLQEWNCPKCDFLIGKTKMWPQKKSAHIRAWHPEDRKALNIPQGRLRTLEVPKSGEKVLWQCPHCELAIPADSATNGDQRYKMKKKHHAECHPYTDFKAFCGDFRPLWAANAAKATQKVRAAGVARRLLGLKKGEGGPHNPVIVTLPPTRKGKKMRNMTKVTCKKCASLESSFKLLAKMPCQQFGSSRGPQRKGPIQRLQGALGSDDVDEWLKQGCQQVISITQQASLAADPENKDHHVEASVWPIDSTVR